MKDVRVGFSTTDAPISRIIRWVTQSRASHCFFLYASEDLGKDVVMEAATEGFRVMPWDVFRKRNRVIQVVTPAPTYPLVPAVRKIAEHLGSAYDFGGLAGAGAVVAAKRGGFRIKNATASSHSLFCSEAVVRALQLAGYPGTEKMDPEGTTPEDLRLFFMGG